MLGLRKFILACVVLAVSTGLVLLDKLSGAEFVTVTLGNSGVFMAANAVNAWGKDR